MVIKVQDTGRYTGDDVILWNEVDDGSMPDITLGGMVRQGSALVFNQERKDLHDAVILEEQSEQTRRDEIESAVKGDATFNTFKAMSSAEQDDWWAGTTAAQKNKALLWLLKDRVRR